MSEKSINTTSCQIGARVKFPSECNQNFKNPTHVFIGGEYYRDGKYFGDVIYSDEKTIQVECKNGNKYMQGQIITLTTQ
jgi:hypothetical protein